MARDKDRKPYNKSTGRDYKSDYKKFQATEKAKKDRAARNKVRRRMLEEGRVHKGDNKDIDHRNSNPRDDSPANLRVMSRSKNRGRTRNGKKV